MDDKAFNELMARKRAEAAKPGYGAQCAAKAAAHKRTRNQDQSEQELILS